MWDGELLLHSEVTNSVDQKLFVASFRALSQFYRLN